MILTTGTSLSKFQRVFNGLILLNLMVKTNPPFLAVPSHTNGHPLILSPNSIAALAAASCPFWYIYWGSPLDLLSIILFWFHWAAILVGVFSLTAAVLRVYFPNNPHANFWVSAIPTCMIFGELIRLLTHHKLLSKVKQEWGPPISCRWWWVYESEKCTEYYAQTSFWYFNGFRVALNLGQDLANGLGSMIGGFFGSATQGFISQFAWYFQFLVFAFIASSILFLVPLFMGVETKLTTAWASISFAKKSNREHRQIKSTGQRFGNTVAIVKESLQQSGLF
ncbi:unnamed protein product, partial [Mesorhabditis spiculigera]